MKSSFEKQIRIRFRQVDAANVIYFSRVQEICHDVFEDFLCESGLPWPEWFRNPKIAVPIKKCETEFSKPLIGGELYSVQMKIPHIGQHSFVTQYEIGKGARLHCVTSLVHVFIDIESGEKSKIPHSVLPYLEKIHAQ